MSDENSKGPNYYPFDYDTLFKGQYIPPEECERLTGVRRHERMYSLKVQELIDGIHRERNARGMPVVAKGQGDGISILTDEEAVVYVRARFRAGLRLAGRSHERAVVAIDVTALPEEVKRKHERNIELQSRQLTSVAVEKAKLNFAPHKRQTPTLEKKPS
jgi:hypothetical protein